MSYIYDQFLSVVYMQSSEHVQNFYDWLESDKGTALSSTFKQNEVFTLQAAVADANHARGYIDESR